MVEARVLVLTLVVALFGAGLIGYVGYLGHTVHDVRPRASPRETDSSPPLVAPNYRSRAASEHLPP